MNYFWSLALKQKIAFISFVLGKLLSIPTALSLFFGDLDRAEMYLYCYGILIFISILFSLSLPAKKKRALPDGVFRMDGITLTIKNGEVLDYKIEDC